MHLTTSLVFMEDDEALTDKGIIRTIYDPTAGTGGFLSSGMEYVHELNPKAVMDYAVSRARNLQFHTDESDWIGRDGLFDKWN